MFTPAAQHHASTLLLGLQVCQNGNVQTVVQFLSYGGTFTAVGGPAAGQMSTDIGRVENTNTPVGSSLQLTGDGSRYSDFQCVFLPRHTDTHGHGCQIKDQGPCV